MQSVEENSDGPDIETIASNNTATAQEFESLLQGLLNLYEQDLHNELCPTQGGKQDLTTSPPTNR